MSNETRVVLVKPGDVLVLGNVWLSSHSLAAEVMKRFKELTGITSVVVFADDIQLDLLTGQQLADLVKRADACATKETT